MDRTSETPIVVRLARPGAEGDRGGATERRETVAAALIATSVAAAVVLLGPPPGDASAHLYRTWLVERGVFLWDNLWFAGSYPILTYSPLYYVLAALVGNTVLTVTGTLVTATSFAALAVRQWGADAVWPARVFAVFAAGPLITGTAPYGLGLAAAVACVLALQRRRQAVAGLLAAATIAFSALAFFFLCLTLAAIGLVRRQPRREIATIGAALAVPAAGWAVMSLLFPSDGRYPFAWWSLLASASTAATGAWLALQSPRARVMAVFFILWLASCVVLYVVPTPVGEIVTRLRYVVFPLMLLTVALGGNRPRWLAAIALVGAATYNVVPYVASVTVRITGDENAAERAFWQPTIDFLDRHHSPNHVVAVVATGAHWEAYHLPKAGFPVLRGWYRQIDIARNDVLYDPSARPADYRRWLHENAVRYVVLPDIRLDPYTGSREAKLVRDPATGLVPVMRTEDVTIFELPDATPLLTGPGAAAVTELTHGAVAGWVGDAGEHRLRLTWSPHWQVASGDVELRSSSDGRIIVDAASAGTFRLETDAELMP